MSRVLFRDFRLVVIVALLAQPLTSCEKSDPPEPPTEAVQASEESVESQTTEAPPSQIATGDYHSCSLRPDGQVVCWGGGAQVLAVSPMDTLPDGPTSIAGLSEAIDLAAGGTDNCALLSSGQVSCWGGGFGAPGPVEGLNGARQIACGPHHCCAALEDGTAACWGENEDSQLGNGGGRESESAVAVVGLDNVAQVACGEAHSCALSTDGSISCWGSNEDGRLGDGTQMRRSGAVQVVNVAAATAIASSHGHSCALVGEGDVHCWGYNLYGGAGSAESGTTLPVPTKVEGIANAVTVAVGRFHSCAVVSGGEVICWGSNEKGQLGAGTQQVHRNPPTRVEGLSNVMALSAGPKHTCAHDSAHRVFCWGSNSNGQLGVRPVQMSTTALPVHGLTDAVDIDTGEHHGCAVRTNGEVLCWGLNEHGQLGVQDHIPETAIPALVQGLADAVEVACAYQGASSCARRANGEVLCWGRNTYGQLGNGLSDDSHTPVPVEGIADAQQITMGTNHTCALHATGEVSCWGKGTAGQLGSGEAPRQQTTPLRVNELSDVVLLSAGYEHTCALKTGGDLFCWGSNTRGQLGAGVTEGNAPTPVRVDRDVIDVSASRTSTCVVTHNGQVQCWGRLTSFVEEPGEVFIIADLTDAQGVSFHANSGCVVRQGGVLVCIGSNTNGELGHGLLTSSDTAVQVQGVSGVADVSLRSRFACALQQNGHAFCWGRNNSGQLGNGEVVSHLTPLAVEIP